MSLNKSICVCVCVLGHLLGSDFHYQGRFSANTPVTGPPDLTVGTPQAKSPARGLNQFPYRPDAN